MKRVRTVSKRLDIFHSRARVRVCDVSQMADGTTLHWFILYYLLDTDLCIQL